MRHWRILGLLLPLLCGCDSFKDAIGLHQQMQVPAPPEAPPAQQTPDLQRRANAEREAVPQPPLARAPSRDWPNLGQVPPKPTLPTPQDIQNATTVLQAEQQKGAAAIAAQAGAPAPVTLAPRAGTTPARSQPSMAVVSPPPGPYLSGAAGMQTPEAQLFSSDNQMGLPQSQVLEKSDMLPPDAR